MADEQKVTEVMGLEVADHTGDDLPKEVLDKFVDALLAKGYLMFTQEGRLMPTAGSIPDGKLAEFSFDVDDETDEITDVRVVFIDDPDACPGS